MSHNYTTACHAALDGFSSSVGQALLLLNAWDPYIR